MMKSDSTYSSAVPSPECSTPPIVPLKIMGTTLDRSARTPVPIEAPAGKAEPRTSSLLASVPSFQIWEAYSGSHEGNASCDGNELHGCGEAVLCKGWLKEELRCGGDEEGKKGGNLCCGSHNKDS